jgi:hypothetical protein
MTFLDLLLDLFDLFHLNSQIPFFLLYLKMENSNEMYCSTVAINVGKVAIRHTFRRYLASNTILFIPFCLIPDFWSKTGDDPDGSTDRGEVKR